MEIAIKGMVCRHCVEAVEHALAAAGITGATARLGYADIPDTLATPKEFARLDKELEARGFTRITDAGTLLIEQAKRCILKHVRDEDCHFNLSACISDHLGVDYSTLSKLFSAREGRTIEQYHIAQRIEYVKELLSYGEMNISEVADKAGYSSVAHLSRQFKTITGMTPTAYLKGAPLRTPLNEV